MKIIIDNFCTALLSSVQKLTALSNISKHFLRERERERETERKKKKKIEGNMFKKVIHI